MTVPVVVALLSASALAVALPHPRLTTLGRGLAVPEFWIPFAACVWPVVNAAVESATGGIAPEPIRSAILAAPSGLVAVWFVALRTRERSLWTLPPTGTILLGAVGVVAVWAACTGQSWQQCALSALALTPALLVRKGMLGYVVAGICTTVVLLSIGLALYGLALGGAESARGCTVNPTKCELLGSYIAVGIDGASNAFAITLAVLSPIVVLAARRRRSIWVVLGLVGSAVASGGRLAALSLCCAVGGVAAASLLRRTRLFPMVCALACAGGVATAVIPLPGPWFTYRAELWSRARGMIVESPLWGHGPSFWVRNAVTQPMPSGSYSPHNLWLDLLVAAGVSGVAVLVTAVWLGVRAVPAGRRRWVWAALTGLAAAGIFEATVMPFRFGPLFGCLVTVVAVLGAAARRTDAAASARRMAQAVVARVLTWVSPVDAVVVHGWPDSEENALRVAGELSLRALPGVGVTLLCEDPSSIRRHLTLALGQERVDIERLRIVRKDSLSGVWSFVRARLVLCTHGLFGNPPPGPHRLHVLLGHGHGPKGASPKGRPFLHNAQLATTNNALWGLRIIADQSIDVVRGAVVSGNPRDDAFHEPVDRSLLGALGIDADVPVVLWLPTHHAERSADADGPISGGAGCPSTLALVLAACARRGVAVVTKKHGLDDRDLRYPDHVTVVDEAALAAAGMTFRQLIAVCDGLVSDYSSVWVDFLVLTRPVGLVLDDIDEFTAHRELNPPPLGIVAPSLILDDRQSVERFVEHVIDVRHAGVPSQASREVAERLGLVSAPGSTARVLDAVARSLRERGLPALFAPPEVSDP